MKEKITTEGFVLRSRIAHGDRYDYSMTIYEGFSNKVLIKCKEHGIFEQYPADHYNGRNGCRKCSKILTRKKEEFIQKAILIHGDLYDYSETVYKGTKQLVKIICKIHGDFHVLPYNHLKGNTCKECSLESRKFTTEEFILRSQEIHGNRYDYSQFQYMGYHRRSTIICNEHGVFLQSPEVHYRGSGCSACRNSMSKGEEFILLWLNSKSIAYEREKSFDNLSFKKKLQFDFYLPEYNVIIEFDGEHHYLPILYNDTLAEAIERFELVKIRDNIKNKYCKENCISLFRISYFEDIEQKLDEIEKLLRKL